MAVAHLWCAEADQVYITCFGQLIDPVQLSTYYRIFFIDLFRKVISICLYGVHPGGTFKLSLGVFQRPMSIWITQWTTPADIHIPGRRCMAVFIDNVDHFA